MLGIRRCVASCMDAWPCVRAGGFGVFWRTREGGFAKLHEMYTLICSCRVDGHLCLEKPQVKSVLLFHLLGERENESTFREVLILAARFRSKTTCLVGWERQNRLDGLRLRMCARRILSRFIGARERGMPAGNAINRTRIHCAAI